MTALAPILPPTRAQATAAGRHLLPADGATARVGTNGEARNSGRMARPITAAEGGQQ